MLLDGKFWTAYYSAFHCIKSDASLIVCSISEVEFAGFCIASLWISSLLFVERRAQSIANGCDCLVVKRGACLSWRIRFKNGVGVKATTCLLDWLYRWRHDNQHWSTAVLSHRFSTRVHTVRWEPAGAVLQVIFLVKPCGLCPYHGWLEWCSYHSPMLGCLRSVS